MRLISWNVAARVACIRSQAKALGTCHPDIVALQEIMTTTTVLWPFLVMELGLAYTTTSLESPPGRTDGPTPPKRAGVLIGSRWPIAVLPAADFDVPWAQCIASACIESPFGRFELHTIHVPPATVVGWAAKAATLDGVYERLACHTNLPRVLCGDFNSPKAEYPDGRVLPFGSGRTRQAEAELRILEGLEAFDLPDAYRQLHGYEADDRSWYWQGRGRRIGRRFDHVFASRLLNPVSCQYLHGFREDRLSDHSAVEVVFAPRRRWHSG